MSRISGKKTHRWRGLLHRQYYHLTAVVPLALKDVESSSSVVQAERSAKLGLPLQKVFCPLAVKLVDSFNDSVEVVSSAGVVHGSACLNSR